MNQNLNKTEAAPTKLYAEEWGTMEWLVDDSLISGANMSVALMVVKKEMNPPAHRHPNSNEMIHVLQGTVELTLDGEKAILKHGDSLFTPAGTVHQLKNLGNEDLKMMVTYSEGKRIYEKA